MPDWRYHFAVNRTLTVAGVLVLTWMGLVAGQGGAPPRPAPAVQAPAPAAAPAPAPRASQAPAAPSASAAASSVAAQRALLDQVLRHLSQRED